MDSLQEWCLDSGMTLDIDKTTVISFICKTVLTLITKYVAI
jgi:hypothetical protein